MSQDNKEESGGLLHRLFGRGGHMIELDRIVGELLIKLDDPGITDNAIVLFTSDNGAEVMSWPDCGNTPFKGEKGTTWEGGVCGFQAMRTGLVPKMA